MYRIATTSGTQSIPRTADIEPKRLYLVLRPTGRTGDLIAAGGTSQDSSHTLTINDKVPPLVAFGIYANDSTLQSTRTWTGDTFNELEINSGGNLTIRYKIYGPSDTIPNITIGNAGSGRPFCHSFFAKLNT
jgi:hypothetical protein